MTGGGSREPLSVVTRAVVALALAFLSAACSNALEVDYRGRRELAEGSYRVALPLLFGSERYVLAADIDRSMLVLVPFDGSAACDLGEATRAVAYWTSDGLRVGMFHESEDGSEWVQFFDAECEEHLDPVTGVVAATFTTGAVLVDTLDGRLLSVDPWRDRVRVLTDSYTRRGPYARDALGNATGLWLLEGDSLLVRDFEGEPVGDPIEGVVTLTAVSDGADELVYVDDEGTHLLSVDRQESRRIYDPGCSPRLELRAAWLDDEGSRRVTMLSPCEEGRLVAIDLPEKSGGAEPPDPVVTTYARDVTSWWHRTVLLPFDPGELVLSGTWTFYRTRGASELDPERVWIAPPVGEPAEIDVDVRDSGRLWPWLGAPGRSAWQTHGRWLFVTADAALGAWSSETGFEPIAENVERLGLAELDDPDTYAWITLHAVEGGVGTLSRISASGSLETLVRAVPPTGLLDLTPNTTGGAGVIRLDPPTYDAVVHDYDGATGELVLLDPQMTAISSGVPPDDVRIFKIELRGSDLSQEAMPTGALGYLHDFDAGAEVGSLTIRLEDGRAFQIDDDVSSYRPSLDFFEPGIVYAIGTGERRGLWFAAQ